MDPDRVCPGAGSGGLDPAIFWPSAPRAPSLEHHLARPGPPGGRDAGAGDGPFSSPALRFHDARLAYRGSVPGAVLADRAVLPGSEPQARAASAYVRPLADAADGPNLWYFSHRVRPGSGNRLLVLLSAGAAWPARHVRGGTA